MVKQKARNIGIAVKHPKEACSDVRCPIHGKLSVRGKVIEGTVVSAGALKTAIVERHYLHYLPKYERYEHRHTRIPAYNPMCISAKVGDRVRIAECRHLSKTKAFVVIDRVV